ncbi:MAG: arylsulfatase [Verrucomicrobiales bacterium]|nr:arylsulfatase [Verrucomicrobiales bacterium]
MRFLCLVFFALAPLLSGASHPNVIVILTDDQGWGDLSVSGNTNLSTPHIDSLAADGASFDRFYVSPVCSPTRAEFLTGRYHQRGGVYSTSAGGERLDLDEVTIGDTFKAAGYRTGAFGKWHNGMQYPYHPNGRGFEEFYGFCSGHWGNYFSPMLEHNGTIVSGEGFVVDDFTDKAISYIEQNREKPFFVYLPYNTPHSPMQVPDEFWDRFENKEIVMRHRDPEKEDDLHLRAALAMCENIDWNVGRVLEKLNELNLAEDTIVMYFCDNGPNGYRWNGGMAGRKGSTDEGGVRSPLLIRWPAKIKPATRVNTFGAAIDLLPTLAELSGVPLMSEKPLDGKSLAPLIMGKEAAPVVNDRLIFSGWKTKYSVRSPRFRLSTEGKLYNMIEDPGQYNDVSAEFPEEHATLAKQLKRWKSEMLTELGEDTRPFVIADPGHIWTQIPARDGVPQGNIKRSNKFPNDSFFSNWVSTEDSINWEVEVAEGGNFEVQLFYTCDPGNLGSTLELSFGDSILKGEVTKAHASPLLGREQDRSRRVESYTQDWAPMTLGTIELEAGEGTLSLKATDIPGAEVMDFRLLMLKRL